MENKGLSYQSNDRRRCREGNTTTVSPSVQWSNSTQHISLQQFVIQKETLECEVFVWMGELTWTRSKW